VNIDFAVEASWILIILPVCYKEKILPFDVIEDVITQETGNAFSKLLMLIFLCDSSLLFELQTEVTSYIVLSSGISSHVFNCPKAVSVHLIKLEEILLTPNVERSGTLNCILV